MKIEIDYDDMIIVAIAVVAIVALLTVPGCLRDSAKLRELEDAQHANP